jgi:hypothetical protein
MSSNLKMSVDLFGIATAISGIVHGDQDRSAFVKNLMESTFYAAGQQYNVMVFNLGQNYDERFNGVKSYSSAVYQNLTFGIWVFESGEFTNQGDGGWINWAFKGRFERNGNHVKFNKP